MSEEATEITEQTPEAEIEEQAPAPQARETIGVVTPRQAVEFTSDAMDERYDSVRKVIEADDMLSPSEKALKLLEVDERKERRQRERNDQAKSTEDQIRDGYAKQFGTKRETVDQTWNEAVQENVKRRGRFDYDTAITILEDKLSTKKETTPTPLAEKRPTGQTRIEPRGATRVAATATKPMTVREMMDKAAMGDTSNIPKEVLAEMGVRQ